MLSKLQSLKEEREQGFTLIELLVVILIIGILSAIAIPAFMNQRKSAVDSSVQSDVSNAAKQVETWIVKQGATKKALADEGAIDQIKVSDGTTLTLRGNSMHYTIQGVNTGGDVAANGTGFVYDSTTGGFVKNASAVPTVAAPNTSITANSTGVTLTAPVAP